MLYAIQEKQPVSVLSLMKDYAAYNAWANKTMVDWLQRQPAALMNQEVISSFPSLKATLQHILECQQFWLSVLQKTFVPAGLPKDNVENIPPVFNELKDQSTVFFDYVNALDDKAIQELCYFATPWIDGTCTRYEFIHHCMNHSTYHRGQIVTIARHVGLTDIPMTDYMYYLLIVKKQQSLFAPAMAS